MLSDQLSYYTCCGTIDCMDLKHIENFWWQSLLDIVPSHTPYGSYILLYNKCDQAVYISYGLISCYTGLWDRKIIQESSAGEQQASGFCLLIKNTTYKIICVKLKLSNVLRGSGRGTGLLVYRSGFNQTTFWETKLFIQTLQTFAH